MYSSIVRKGCKNDCGRMPEIGFQGWCSQCRPDLKAAKIKKQKDRNALRSDLAHVRKLEVDNKPPKDYAELDRWFKERRKEMANCCVECGMGTNKLNDKYYKWSICHITPKSLVKSVATHEYNWIELCQLHHQEFDSTFDRAEKMMCFGEVKQKFQLFKDLIPPEELRKVNPHLLTQ